MSRLVVTAVTLPHRFKLPSMDPARWPAQIRSWLSHLTLLRHSPWQLVVAVSVLAALLAMHRRLRYFMARLVLVAVAVCVYIGPLVGWAALAFIPIVVHRRRRWARGVVGTAALWSLGAAVWVWGHPTLLTQAHGLDHDGVLAGLGVGVLVVLGVFGALVWPHLGSKWRPGAEGRFASPEQRAAVIAAWGNRCAVCDADGNAPGVALEIDHIVPYALGGKTDTANFQPLCGPCNRAKGKLSMQEFMRTDYYRRVAMSASY